MNDSAPASLARRRATRPYCSALGRLKDGLAGKVIIQMAIASPASSDMTSIILCHLLSCCRVSRARFNTAIPVWITKFGNCFGSRSLPLRDQRSQARARSTSRRVELPRTGFPWRCECVALEAQEREYDVGQSEECERHSRQLAEETTLRDTSCVSLGLLVAPLKTRQSQPINCCSSHFLASRKVSPRTEYARRM